MLQSWEDVSRHNALIYIESCESDCNDIAESTGDHSWLYQNMLGNYDKVDDWQSQALTDPMILLRDLMFMRYLTAGGAFQGVQFPIVDTATGLIEALLAVDPNNGLPGCDQTQYFFQTSSDPQAQWCCTS